MKSKGIRAIKIILFSIVFLFLFYVVTITLRFKDDIGIEQIEDFYHYPENSFDVINIGSSHVGVNLDPEILLEEYGIKSYNLWASVQPAWNSYYYLKEALKYQNPKLICVETSIMVQELEYSDYSRAIYNTLGMKPSMDKYEAIKVSVSEEMRKDFILGWPTYHARYTDLEEADFKRYFWNYELASGKINSGYDSFVNEVPEIITSDETIPLYEKEELRKIIELCKAENIPLLLFTTPYSAPESEQMKYNRIEQIAAEYGEGVTYKNFLYDIDDIPVDFEVDYADGGGHFNNYGIEKFSMYYGRYLKDNFDIPVRNEEYAGKFNLQKSYSCAYRMPESFSGNGTSSYVDTAQSLYDEPDRSWTLFADFNTDIYSEDQVYFSCYSEETDAYRGLLVKREDDKLYVIVGANYYMEVPILEEAYARMALVKDKDTYTLYMNGEKIEEAESSCESFDGNLLIGCEQDENLQPYRFSAATVFELEVYNEVVGEKDIMTWENLERTNAEAITGSIQESVEYYMETPFEGDGIDDYLDTGIQLYDDPMRNWTLLTEIDLNCDKNASDLVYLSCFNEEADNYHGLILRYKDNNELVLGNTYYLDIPDNGQDTMKIVIEKNGGIYTVYVDGEEFASDISSFCSSYMGSLLVGSQEESDLPIRISPVTVKQLEIYDELVPAEEIAGW